MFEGPIVIPDSAPSAPTSLVYPEEGRGFGHIFTVLRKGALYILAQIITRIIYFFTSCIPCYQLLKSGVFNATNPPEKLREATSYHWEYSQMPQENWEDAYKEALKQSTRTFEIECGGAGNCLPLSIAFANLTKYEQMSGNWSAICHDKQMELRHGMSDAFTDLLKDETFKGSFLRQYEHDIQENLPDELTSSEGKTISKPEFTPENHQECITYYQIWLITNYTWLSDCEATLAAHHLQRPLIMLGRDGSNTIRHRFIASPEFCNATPITILHLGSHFRALFYP